MPRRSITNAILDAMKGQGWMLARDISKILQVQGYKASPQRVARIIADMPEIEREYLARGSLYCRYRLKGEILPIYHIEELERRFRPSRTNGARI